LFVVAFFLKFRKTALQTAKSDLRTDLRRLEEQQQEEIASAKELQSKELVTLRLDFDHSMRELQAKYDQRLEELKQDLELRRKVSCQYLIPIFNAFCHWRAIPKSFAVNF
jgi:DNA anti-recombination protein RmuC